VDNIGEQACGGSRLRQSNVLVTEAVEEVVMA
jgi:hypothetical protein